MTNQNWFNRLFFGAPARRANLLQARADAGDAEAQYNVAVLYSIREDYTNAATWYLKAAKQDHALAQLNLGIIHSKAQGVARNCSEACAWFTKSAEQGDPGAQFHLGVEKHRLSFDQNTVDAAESRIEAYKWLHLATKQQYVGSEAASDRITMSMDQKEISAGNERIARFIEARSGATDLGSNE